MAKNSKIGVIIQARVGSKRLPGKVLLKLNGKPILQHVIERAKRAQLPGVIAVATTRGKEQPIIGIAKKCGVKCFRGSANNVLSRYIDCAEKFGIETIVRVCADSPLISPKFLDATIKRHLRGLDYTNTNLPEGIGCEVVSLAALKKIRKLTKNKKHLEHVTSFIRENKSMFKTGCFLAKKKIFKNGLKFTVDTKADFEFVKAIAGHFEKNFSKVESEKIMAWLGKEKLEPNYGRPYVSVMINTYNYGKMLGRAIKSALKQTMPLVDYEVVVVDDGSTDGTQKVIKSFGNKIRPFKRLHRGNCSAGNFAFGKARGKYVIKLDADDWLEENCLEKLFRALEKNPRKTFAYCDIKHIRGRREQVVSLRKFNAFNTVACGIMFRKSAIQRFGKMYKPDLFFPEYDLLLRLGRKGIYTSGTHYNYYRHSKSLTANSKAVENGLNQIKKIHGVK